MPWVPWTPRAVQAMRKGSEGLLVGADGDLIEACSSMRRQATLKTNAAFAAAVLNQSLLWRKEVGDAEDEENRPEWERIIKLMARDSPTGFVLITFIFAAGVSIHSGLTVHNKGSFSPHQSGFSLEPAFLFAAFSFSSEQGIFTAIAFLLGSRLRSQKWFLLAPVHHGLLFTAFFSLHS
jgi:hypothetical protein